MFVSFFVAKVFTPCACDPWYPRKGACTLEVRKEDSPLQRQKLTATTKRPPQQREDKKLSSAQPDKVTPRVTWPRINPSVERGRSKATGTSRSRWFISSDCATLEIWFFQIELEYGTTPAGRHHRARRTEESLMSQMAAHGASLSMTSSFRLGPTGQVALGLTETRLTGVHLTSLQFLSRWSHGPLSCRELFRVVQDSRLRVQQEVSLNLTVWSRIHGCWYKKVLVPRTLSRYS